MFIKFYEVMLKLSKLDEDYSELNYGNHGFSMEFGCKKIIGNVVNFAGYLNEGEGSFSYKFDMKARICCYRG
jgi:hypothetical protein